MALFVFGPRPGSWYITNDVYRAGQDIPAALQKEAEDDGFNGTTVEFVALSVTGMCFYPRQDPETGDLTKFFTTSPSLAADVKPQRDGSGVKFISFSLDNAWFIRYGNDSVRLSQQGSFPKAFHKLAGQYMKTRGKIASSMQHDTGVEYIWFGANDSVLLAMVNGDLEWDGLEDELTQELRDGVENGWRLGSRTTLCPYDVQYYFLQWEDSLGNTVGHSWSIKCDGPLNDLFVREMTEGVVPEGAESSPSAENVDEDTNAYCCKCGQELGEAKSFWTCTECPVGLGTCCEHCAGSPPVCEQNHQMNNFEVDDNGGVVAVPDISNLSISSTSEMPTPTADGLLQPSATSRNRRPTSSASHREDDEETKKLKDALEGAIVSENPNVHWDDVAGLEVAKEELQEAVVLPMKFPQLFTGRRQSRKGILLYGPPGTGKSYLAKAVATEVDATLFSVSSSDLVSKWMGESERLVKTLFDMARERKPSVIFIDELEGIASSRDSGGADNEHSNRIKTEILVQMDGVGKDATGILVLAATNLPWKLDAALRRRFQKRIHIALPNIAARKKMFETGARHAQCIVEEKDLEQLASMTEGYSGSDISIVVQDTLMIPVKKIRTAKYWRKIVKDGTEKFEPCDQNDTGALPMTLKQVPSNKLSEPSVLPKDFFTALSKVKPSVSQEDFQKTKEWTEEFGEEGA